MLSLQIDLCQLGPVDNTLGAYRVALHALRPIGKVSVNGDVLNHNGLSELCIRGPVATNAAATNPSIVNFNSITPYSLRTPYYNN